MSSAPIMTPSVQTTGRNPRTGPVEERSRFSERAQALRPFYFNVVVWGERFRNHFLNWCLPTLLSPNNIPALLNRGNKFLICTTPEDWAAMEQASIFALLKTYVEPVLLEIPLPPPGRSGCQHMGIGHKLATDMMYSDRAYGVMMTPDFMLSDGSLSAIQRHAVEGKQVVLTAALRFGEEPLFENLAKMGIAEQDSRFGEQGRPLPITGRQLVAAGIRSFHSESLRYEWEAPYFTDFPVACWWRVPEEDGIVLHCLSWAALLFDYAALECHDTSTLDHWTIDGDYVWRNVHHSDRIHVCQDSDEIMIVSWAPLSDRALSLTPDRKKSWPVIGEWVKGAILRDAFLSPVYDPLKRSIFRLPVRWHARDLNEAWATTERRALRAIRRHLLDEELSFSANGGCLPGGSGSVSEVTPPRPRILKLGVWLRRKRVQCLGGLGVLLRVLRLTIEQSHYWRRMLEVILRAFKGDRTAWFRIVRRTKIFWDQLLGRPVDDW